MQIEKIIRDNWHTFFPQRKVPEKLPIIFLRSYKKNSLFFMDGSSGFPVCVVSISTALTGERLQREAHALKNLNELNLENFKDAYPCLYFFEELDGHEVLIKSFVHGRKMSKYAKGQKQLFWKKNFKSNMLRIENRLTEFHQATKTQEKKLSKEYISEFLGLLSTRLEANTQNKEVLFALGDSLVDKSMFNVFAHGDLHLDNILVKPDEGLALIDWDLSAQDGFPLWDLLDLAVFYCRLIRGGWKKGKDLKEYVEDAFLGNNSITVVNNQTINDYLSKMKLDADIARLLFLLWIEKRFQNAELLRSILINIDRVFMM